MLLLLLKLELLATPRNYVIYISISRVTQLSQLQQVHQREEYSFAFHANHLSYELRDDLNICKKSE